MSGSTGVMIRPHPKPMTASPNIMKAGVFWIPKSFEVPTKKIPVAVIPYPNKMTVDFLNFEVSKYIRGVVEA